MELKKIEGILTALGYIEGEIDQIKVNESADGVDISFHAKKRTTVLNPKELPKEENVTANKIMSNITYPIKVPEVKKPVKSDYKPAQNRSLWKTPVPRTTTRYVFFKDRKSADNFIKEYSKDFEFRDDEIRRDSAVRCELRLTKKDEPMYYEGYPWCLSFRMNGAAFEVLENCEGLKKRVGGKRGGACIRLKD